MTQKRTELKIRSEIEKSALLAAAYTELLEAMDSLRRALDAINGLSDRLEKEAEKD